MFLNAALILFAYSAISGNMVTANGPLVDSPAGLFRGKYGSSLSGRQYASFSGIPYAKPPVGDLRFKEPVPADKISGEYDATKEREDCFQLNMGFHRYPLEDTNDKEYVGSEDCLYLNVFTPDIKPAKLYPVLVVIHGGAYIVGSGSELLNGPTILLDKDVVVVSINYRLGAFGFFNMEGVVSGNLGLRDQSMSLRWVRDNIASFGGNPKQVTILGESAGSSSVHQQMLSPLSKGLFQRAISQSGTSFTNWSIHKKEIAKKNTEEYVKSLECNLPKDQILTCLQSKSAEEIFQKCQKFQKFPLHMVFRPIAEEEGPNAFLTEKSIMAGSTVPWINGVTSGEGFCVIGDMVVANRLEKLNDNRKELLPIMMQYEDSPKKDMITDKLLKHYLKGKAIGKETTKETIKLFSDGWFFHGFQRANEKHRGPLFQYYFDYQGEKSFYDVALTKSLNYGVNHGDDYMFLFHMKKYYPRMEFNERDREISKEMLNLWYNFVAQGNPTPKGSHLVWPDSRGNKKYLRFSQSGLSIEDDLFGDSLDFWENLHFLPHLKDEL